MSTLNFSGYKEEFTILIADDNEDNRYLLEKQLERVGYKEIKHANDGVEALEIIKKEKVDLLLLDIIMPRMNGYEVLEHLKKDIERQHIMVLMISSSDEFETAVKCIKMGAEDFLQKPFNYELLRVRIRSCLRRKWFLYQEKDYLKSIEVERQRNEELLYAIFPAAIVKKLTEKKQVEPREHSNVAVLFSDVVGFTRYCSLYSPSEVFNNLQELVDIFETISMKYGVQKIKTIGDAFMATAGMFSDGNKEPVLACIHCGLEMIAASKKLAAKWDIRVGIDFGNVVTGIVGHRQYLFDVWGDVVNTASRIQTIAEANTIYLSKSAWETVQSQCVGKSLGDLAIKGKPSMEIFKYESFRDNS